MRTFWVGLAVMAMTAATWGSDEVDLKVGDWVMAKETRTTGKSDMSLITTYTQVVKVIEDGVATFSVKATRRTSDGDRPGPDTPSVESKIPLAEFNSPDLLRLRDKDEDGVKIEVLEEGERTVEVNGVAFENVFYQKAKITQTKESGLLPGPVSMMREGVVEIWVDDKGPLVMARMLKRVATGMAALGLSTAPEGFAEVTSTVERVAYGRAGDPIPEDGGDDAPEAVF